jgi:uncharacterized protein (TIGR02271 family)
MEPEGNVVEFVLREERLKTGTVHQESGRVRAVTHVDDVPYEQAVLRTVEQAELVREPAADGDSGEVLTLPDGSLSIPVFEEQLVITKRLVVRERVIVRKHTVHTEQVVTATLRRERVEIETTGEARLVDPGEPPTLGS